MNRPFHARCRNGIWSVWRIDGNVARYITSAYTLKEALQYAEMRKGTPALLAQDYPIERLRAI